MDHVGLNIRDDDVMTPLPQYMSHDADLKGIGSHHYVHNTPVDYVLHADTHMQGGWRGLN